MICLLFECQSNSDDSKDDYADLPPNQRRKRIQAKIDQIQTQFTQETSVRYNFSHFITLNKGNAYEMCFIVNICLNLMSMVCNLKGTA